MPLSGRRFFDRMEGKTRKTIKRRRAEARRGTSQELGYTESRRRDAADGRESAASDEGRTEDALAPGGDEGRGRLRKAAGRRERP